MLEKLLILLWALVMLYLPACLGSLVGRYAPLALRLLLALLLLSLEYHGWRLSIHGLERFFWPGLFYAAGCAYGLLLKAGAKDGSFRAEYHVDWLAVAGANLVFMALYVRPIG